MVWFKKVLGDFRQSMDRKWTIRFTFEALHNDFGFPQQPGEAFFTKCDFEKELVTAYITPEGALVAVTHFFEVCEKPPIADLELFYGSQAAWEIYFPDEEAKRTRS